ncbi:MAG: N-acetylmuramoyl-L-alanine amidase [Prevotella sp.]|nr:N-acetylmuramoyl-L-alanine amidase [Prevotella sp.]
MSKKIVLLLITLISFAVAVNAASKPFTLVIDAGHGGHDTGAVGAISKEKNLTLKFALAFGRMVEKNCPGVKVVYTRKTDRFVELYRRAEIANQNKADLFISIHINALPKGRVARGFQTYTLGTSKRTGKKTGVMQNLEVAKRENSVIFLEKDYKQTYHGYDPNSPESDIMFEYIQDKNMENSVELAKYMQRYVCQATGRQDMGAQQDNLAVLRLSSMPGCLVELGFISTRDEEQYMNSSRAEEQYARGLFNAFLAYWKKHDKSVTIPFRPEPKGQTVDIPKIVPQQEAKPARAENRKRQSKTEVAQQPVAAEQANQDVASVSASGLRVPEAIRRPDLDEQSELLQEPQPVEQAQPAQQPEPEPLPEPVQQPEPIQQPQPAEQPVQQFVQQPEPVQQQAPAPVVILPVFKVQILASSSKVKPGDVRLKGHKADYYREGGMYKYTVGASDNYYEIYRLRKSLASAFPEAFIIAFKDGSRMDVNEAIREFKSRRANK